MDKLISVSEVQQCLHQRRFKDFLFSASRLNYWSWQIFSFGSKISTFNWAQVYCFSKLLRHKYTMTSSRNLRADTRILVHVGPRVEARHSCGWTGSAVKSSSSKTWKGESIIKLLFKSLLLSSHWSKVLAKFLPIGMIWSHPMSPAPWASYQFLIQALWRYATTWFQFQWPKHWVILF